VAAWHELTNTPTTTGWDFATKISAMAYWINLFAANYSTVCAIVDKQGGRTECLRQCLVLVDPFQAIGCS